MDDISDLIAADAVTCCPICDNAIDAWEPFAVVRAHGFAVIVHDMCLEGEENEEEGGE